MSSLTLKTKELWKGGEKHPPPQCYNETKKPSAYRVKIGTNIKISLDGEKDKPDAKSKEVEMIKSEPDVKSKVKTKPDVKSNKEHKQDVKPNIELKHDVMMIRTKPDTNKIAYEEEKVALILGTTAVLTVWWMFK